MLKEENRVLPNFLGIGAQRSGTTWLYNIFKKHPEIYLYSYLKEINFFNNYSNKGLSWYKQFFPDKNEAKKYKAIGEISPCYISSKQTPECVLKALPNARFILILRNPVNRLFSEYFYSKLIRNDYRSFNHFLKSTTERIKIGLYAQQLKNWLNYFPIDRFLILIFEEAIKEPLSTFKKVSEFLNVDYEKFNQKILTTKIHSSDLPRFHKLYLLGYKFAYKLNKFLISKDLWRISAFIKTFKKTFSLFGYKNEKEKINPVIKNQLWSYYKKDIDELEKILNRDLSIWKDY